MEANTGFRNELIDLARLPRYETVPMKALKRAYWKVVMINFGILFAILGVALVCGIVWVDEIAAYKIPLLVFYVVLLVLTRFFARLAFNRKAYAFRDHDVLFSHGVIATATIVIPYNRIQHVALHEGVFSRMFGLAEIKVFTAGGSGEIEIPGIRKAEAEDIKQLLMGKIQKRL